MEIVVSETNVGIRLNNLWLNHAQHIFHVYKSRFVGFIIKYYPFWVGSNNGNVTYGIFVDFRYNSALFGLVSYMYGIFVGVPL